VILLIDTSTSTLTVGIATQQGELLKSIAATAGPQERGIHDSKLALTIKELLRSCSLQAKSIEKIGLVSGPGSFTGLRIGFAFAKGFAFGIGVSLVAVSSHELIARAAEGKIYDAIVTPGYQPTLLYVSHREAPNEIHGVELVHFIADPSNHKVIGPAAATALFTETHKEFTQIEPTVTVLALIAAERPGLKTPEEVASLEPHYVTEFQTNQV